MAEYYTKDDFDTLRAELERVTKERDELLDCADMLPEEGKLAEARRVALHWYKQALEARQFVAELQMMRDAGSDWCVRCGGTISKEDGICQRCGK